MTIQWGLFLPSLLLLLFPADRLLSSQVELRSFDCFRGLGEGSSARPWWWVPALWLDPLRGYFGADLLRNALGAGYTRWVVVSTPAYVSLIALIAIAVVAQTLTRKGDHGVLLAPIGFASGVSAALTPWAVAVIAVATALLGLFGFRQFYAYFVFGGIATGVLGSILNVAPIWVVPAACVFLLPVVTGVLTNSTLELPARNSSGSRELPRNHA